MKDYLSLRIGKRFSSFQLHKKTILFSLLSFLIVIAVAVVSLGMGEMKIASLDVVKVLLGIGSEENALIVEQFRLPRIVIAILVGAALAVAGAIMQGLVRNPLASPDILGVSGGASVFAVGFLILFETASIKWLPPIAFLGATLTTFLLYALSWKKGVTPLRLVMIGVGIKIAAGAIVTMLIMFSPFLLQNKALLWLTGSIYGVDWNDVFMILPWVVGLILVAGFLARRVNIQQLGDDLATSLGSSLQLDRFLLLMICAALTGTAVSVGGDISFVALLAPHIAKQLIGPSFGGAMTLSAFLGAIIVLLADLIGRMAFSPIEVPVGVFTSAIGAPFFIYLLYKNRNR
ncbi:MULTISPECIES: iron ABC transporter permease [Brevibacillus]|uniref:FecCD family ABC transporter permease n=1 Tax=Brevibacillus TaxID=55080 RepID=UPI000D0EE279|nr:MULTISPECIES: iron ABC transporter permease [Brevibacillus]MED1946924.1 iron ABC transporter permease [Brevibacillus formosus]MED2001101.1 iron ABC transporter permease [Brevibacillus formosus]MED2080387.1 iron ABC transporter permease [Brevibacillus formosus]PSK19448.1 iron ABC transporter permease [Brevibacillus sp. NRRL NRS-603]